MKYFLIFCLWSPQDFSFSSEGIWKREMQPHWKELFSFETEKKGWPGIFKCVSFFSSGQTVQTHQF